MNFSRINFTNFISAIIITVTPVVTSVAAELPIKDGTYEYKSPEVVDGVKTVNTSEAYSLWKDRAVFVDSRKNTDFEAGRIPGAIQLAFSPKKGVQGQPLNETALEEIAGKNEEVVFYCNGHDCDRSSWSAALAVGWGWNRVYYYRDGYPAWVAANHPTE